LSPRLCPATSKGASVATAFCVNTSKAATTAGRTTVSKTMTGPCSETNTREDMSAPKASLRTTKVPIIVKPMSQLSATTITAGRVTFLRSEGRKLIRLVSGRDEDSGSGASKLPSTVSAMNTDIIT